MLRLYSLRQPTAALRPTTLFTVPSTPHPTPSPLAPLQLRFATKKSGGSSKNGRSSRPKYLGFKIRHGAQCAPSNIIIRQRGFQWHPGQNVGVGRDHTIYSMAKGRVVLHYDIKKQRRYISVDDGTMDPIPPSKKEMKSRLADMVDAEKYLRMDSADRLEYVGELIEVLAKEEEDRKKEAAVRRVTQHGKRKLGLVDLTML